MPFTFSHPAAVLFLRRLRWLDFTALVIGSITPDFGYFIPRFHFATAAHTFAGGFFVCVPTGLLMLALYYGFRVPVCHLLPSPHREALLPLARRFPKWNARALLAACLSLYLGALTHIVWDSFTHESGFFAQHVALLQRNAFVIYGIDVPVFRVLQHISTVAGLAALAFAYGTWLRKTLRAAPALPRESDAGRYALWAILLALPIVSAIPYALWHSNFLPLANAVRTFLYQFTVGYLSVFFPLLGAVSLLLFHLPRKGLPSASCAPPNPL